MPLAVLGFLASPAHATPQIPDPQEKGQTPDPGGSDQPVQHALGGGGTVAGGDGGTPDPINPDQPIVHGIGGGGRPINRAEDFILSEDGFVTSPRGVQKRLAELQSDEWIAFLRGDLFGPAGNLMLTASDADQFEAQGLADGTVGLRDGRVILPDGTLTADLLRLPPRSILMPDTLPGLPSRSILYEKNGKPGRVLLTAVRRDAVAQTGRFLDYLEPGYRLQLEGDLYRAVPHLTVLDVADTKGANIRADGTIVLANGRVLRPNGELLTSQEAGIVFNKAATLQGASRGFDHSPLHVPDGAILLPDGRLLDRAGVDLMPGTVVMTEQFPLVLEGVLYRPVLHVRKADLPRIASIDMRGIIPLAPGRLLMPDGIVLLADGTQITPGGKTIPPAPAAVPAKAPTQAPAASAD